MRTFTIATLLVVLASNLAGCVTTYSNKPDRRPGYLAVHDRSPAGKL